MSKGAPGKDGFNGLPGANGNFFILSNLNRFLFNYYNLPILKTNR